MRIRTVAQLHHCSFFLYSFVLSCSDSLPFMVIIADPQGWRRMACTSMLAMVCKSPRKKKIMWVFISTSVVCTILKNKVSDQLEQWSDSYCSAVSGCMHQFISMVLKTHSVNFLSLAEALYDSSRRRWLSSRRLSIWACRDALASFSWMWTTHCLWMWILHIFSYCKRILFIKNIYTHIYIGHILRHLVHIFIH